MLDGCFREARVTRPRVRATVSCAPWCLEATRVTPWSQASEGPRAPDRSPSGRPSKRTPVPPRPLSHQKPSKVNVRQEEVATRAVVGVKTQPWSGWKLGGNGWRPQPGRACCPGGADGVGRGEGEASPPSPSPPPPSPPWSNSAPSTLRTSSPQLRAGQHLFLGK